MEGGGVLRRLLEVSTDPAWSYLVALFLPYLFALLLTPRVRRLAVRLGWLDHPSGRKQHGTAVPLLGGVAVFGSAFLGVLLGTLVSEPIRVALLGPGSLGALGAGVAAVVALGLYDDLRDLRPWQKLVAQVSIAGATWFLGFHCAAVQLPFGWGVIDAPLASFLITVGWIVLVTNAFNLIDGIDGLTAGIGIAAVLTIVVLAAENGASVSMLGALALSGALSAFLRYNLPPARIYLGDSGAMAVGYTIAVLSVASYQKAPTAMVLLVPILVLGVPLLDTLLAVIRRTRGHLREHGLSAVHPLEIATAIMRADRGHVHYLLMRSGWSVRSVLLTLYAMAVAFGGLALWTREASPTDRWLLWLALLAGSFVALRVLERRVERSEARDTERAAPPSVEFTPAHPGRVASAGKRVGRGS